VRGTSARKKRIIRIVLDSTLRTPPGSKLLSGMDEDELWIYTTARNGEEARKKLEDAGARIITVRNESGRCSMEDVLADLGRMSVASVLIEGGSRTLASAFKGKLVDKVIFFIAPMIIGGGSSISAIGDIALHSLSQAIRLEDDEAVPIGRDIMYRAYPRYQ
jgi:diaminohydroxyphosphoribosylaminopyrimidine deaminase/5-amino-6-(5-phosphoribosylamino)uracil reductase